MIGSIGLATQWLHAETIRILGLTLGHFLWEGSALALLLFVTVAFCRRAQTRYTLAVCTLAAMLVAPIFTFVILSRASQIAVPGASTSGITHLTSGIPAMASRILESSAPESSGSWPVWCACIWLGGVFLLSVRALGGWIVLRRFQRERTQPFSAELIQKCRAFEQRLGLRRRISYLQSKMMDTPSAIGWLRPIVLVPVSAVTGLSAEQLEAVIVHELAHIKRLDCLVNLFQIVAETLLFYHPAVWWVNRVIRNERENCCDDISVEICGNATEYARALTVLESARTSTSWALSATGGVLKARVMRLLRPQSSVAAVSTAGLAIFGVLCTSGVLLATAVVTKTEWKSASSDVAPQQLVDQAPLVKQPLDLAPAPPVPGVKPVIAPADVAQAAPPPAAEPAKPPSSSDSYIGGLKAAGLKDLTVDDVIALKIQGVTPEYVRAMRSGGFDPNVHDLISMKVQGITPEYVNDIRATGLNPALHDLISMKVQGITPAYVREMQSAGLTGIQVHQLISMKVQGIDPEYIRAVRATGLNPTDHEFISLKVQNVTPAYISALKSAGLGDLRVHDYISAKVQDVTPEFIEKVRSHGFKNLTLHQLIELKSAEVF